MCRDSSKGGGTISSAATADIHPALTPAERDTGPVAAEVFLPVGRWAVFRRSSAKLWVGNLRRCA
eukprot:9910321-Alexandrium_andersonii.AAC.2